VGTRGHEELVTEYRRSAVFLANTHEMTTSTRVPIVDDVEVAQYDVSQYNLLLFGGPVENVVTGDLYQCGRHPGPSCKETFSQFPVVFNGTAFGLGDCYYSRNVSRGVGALFTIGLSTSQDNVRIGGVIVGLDVGGLRNIMTLVRCFWLIGIF
jgi:hypothetical protein